MKFTDLFKKKKEERAKPTMLIGFPKSARKEQAKRISEGLKGEVQVQQDNFNKELGVPHPFDFELVEALYNNNGVIAALADKAVEWVWGPSFQVKSDDKQAEKTINDWIKEVNFHFHGRKWLRSAVVKGPGFLELTGKKDESPEQIKVLNANHMFIDMNKKGEIKRFNQFRGGIGGANKDNTIPFKPHEIALYTQGGMGDDPYGLGLIFPNSRKIKQWLESDENMHTLLRRKANSPIVATLGDVEKDLLPDQGSIEDFGNKLTFMNNTTEWAVSALVKLSVLDFGNIGEKFEGPLLHDEQALFAGFQTPEVIMGRGNIPEGLAEVQLEAYDRHIQSIQEDIEKVIEQDIFQRVLRDNDIKASVEIVWGLPGKKEKQAQIKELTELLKNPTLSIELSLVLEKKLAVLIDVELVDSPTRPTPTKPPLPPEEEE